MVLGNQREPLTHERTPHASQLQNPPHRRRRRRSRPRGRHRLRLRRDRRPLGRAPTHTLGHRAATARYRPAPPCPPRAAAAAAPAPRPPTPRSRARPRLPYVSTELSTLPSTQTEGTTRALLLPML